MNAGAKKLPADKTLVALRYLERIFAVIKKRQ